MQMSKKCLSGKFLINPLNLPLVFKHSAVRTNYVAQKSPLFFISICNRKNMIFGCILKANIEIFNSSLFRYKLMFVTFEINK